MELRCSLEAALLALELRLAVSPGNPPSCSENTSLGAELVDVSQSLFEKTVLLRSIRSRAEHGSSLATEVKGTDQTSFGHRRVNQPRGAAPYHQKSRTLFCRDASRNRSPLVTECSDGDLSVCRDWDAGKYAIYQLCPMFGILGITGADRNNILGRDFEKPKLGGSFDTATIA